MNGAEGLGGDNGQGVAVTGEEGDAAEETGLNPRIAVVGLPEAVIGKAAYGDELITGLHFVKDVVGDGVGLGVDKGFAGHGDEAGAAGSGGRGGRRDGGGGGGWDGGGGGERRRIDDGEVGAITGGCDRDEGDPSVDVVEEDVVEVTRR